MNAFKKAVTAAVVTSSLTATVGALAATNDLFLKLDGIKGESADSKHKGEIDILSWSWGVVQPATPPTGGGAGVGKVQFHDISITKHADASSPAFLTASTTGMHIKNVYLTVRKAGGRQVEFIKIKLEDVMVTSFASSAKVDDTLEHITLTFGKIDYEYTPVAADGSVVPSVRFGWDVRTNQKI